MDILDVMDLLDVGHPLTNGRNSPLLDSGEVMEPNNLSQSSATLTNAVMAAADNETAPVSHTFPERNLELKLPILSSSSSESESEEPSNPTAGTSAVVEGERAASPPPNCAICLGRCKNKCFTDSCMHQFCFKCLCEWSKVKPECPLCKQTFKSIIHNVKSIHQFEEYHVQPPTVQLAHPFDVDIFDVVYPVHNRIQAWNGSTYRPYYFESPAFSPAAAAPAAGGAIPTASGSSGNRPAASSANGSGLRNQYVYRGELLDLYRQEYPGAIANSGTLSQLWRRYVYDRKLYAMPMADITGRFRESSARFYRDNPSQIHRLMPWINRDIVCLLRQTQHDVTTVLESINSALTLMNILSPAFRRRLQPYLGTKTAHFIHELNNFARSPYDMIGYDRAVRYSPQTNNEEIVIEFSSSEDSTDNDVAGDGGNNTTSAPRSRSTNATSINAINLTIHNRLTSSSANAGTSRGGGINVGISGSSLNDMQDGVSMVIDLRGESDNNETTSTAQATNNSSNYLNGQNVSTSESDMVTSGTQPTVSENIELTSGSSDECEFVLERKPPHLRTPEMVSLDSASDSDVVFVDESKPLNKTSFSSSEGELNDEPNDHKHHSRHHSKIAALVEAKKRNQSSNLVKSEQQDSQTEVYNLGASTSAALRLSLQKQVDKLQRSTAKVSSKRPGCDKYSLRNSDGRLRTERKAPKRRGKRLYSESSHSSTSSSTTISSSSTTTSSQSSSSSSDEDYMASTSHRKKTAPAGGGDCGTRKRGRKSAKARKRKTSRSCNRRTTKRDSVKQKNNADTSDEDEGEEENGHMGKNFALVMAINERRKRQNQRKSSKARSNEQDDSEGENSWRLKAVNEPLKKQQQQQLQLAKNTHKINERKRQSDVPIKSIEHKNSRKRQKTENKTMQERETQRNINLYNSENTSSDESDNISLIQLKTKLTRQTNTSSVTGMAATANSGNNSENDLNATATSPSTSAVAATPTTATTTEHTTIPTAATTSNTTELSNNSPTTNRTSDVMAATTTKTEPNNVESTVSHNDLFHFSDDSDDTIQNDNGHDQIGNNLMHDNGEQHHLYSSSSSNYHDNNHEFSSLINNDNSNHNDYSAAAHDNETLSNHPPTMNANESNVFADGNSMSTTTTDTILHDAAEQISSSAVNFYNPQQSSFNTADLADENSTNSSSSDSSLSSSSTSLSSSSNTSSSNNNNNNNYSNYARS